MAKKFLLGGDLSLQDEDGAFTLGEGADTRAKDVPPKSATRRDDDDDVAASGYPRASLDAQGAQADAGVQGEQGAQGAQSVFKTYDIFDFSGISATNTNTGDDAFVADTASGDTFFIGSKTRSADSSIDLNQNRGAQGGQNIIFARGKEDIISLTPDVDVVIIRLVIDANGRIRYLDSDSGFNPITGAKDSTRITANMGQFTDAKEDIGTDSPGDDPHSYFQLGALGPMVSNAGGGAMGMINARLKSFDENNLRTPDKLILVLQDHVPIAVEDQQAIFDASQIRVTLDAMQARLKFGSELPIVDETPSDDLAPFDAARAAFNLYDYRDSTAANQPVTPGTEGVSSTVLNHYHEESISLNRDRQYLLWDELLTLFNAPAMGETGADSNIRLISSLQLKLPGHLNTTPLTGVVIIQKQIGSITAPFSADDYIDVGDELVVGTGRTNNPINAGVPSGLGTTPDSGTVINPKAIFTWYRVGIDGSETIITEEKILTPAIVDDPSTPDVDETAAAVTYLAPIIGRRYVTRIEDLGYRFRVEYSFTDTDGNLEQLTSTIIAENPLLSGARASAFEFSQRLLTLTAGESFNILFSVLAPLFNLDDDPLTTTTYEWKFANGSTFDSNRELQVFDGSSDDWHILVNRDEGAPKREFTVTAKNGLANNKLSESFTFNYKFGDATPPLAPDRIHSYVLALGAIDTDSTMDGNQGIDITAGFESGVDVTSYQLIKFNDTFGAAANTALNAAGLYFNAKTGEIVGTLASGADYNLTVIARTEANNVAFSQYNFAIIANDTFNLQVNPIYNAVIGTREDDDIIELIKVDSMRQNLFDLMLGTDSATHFSRYNGSYRDVIIIRATLDAEGELNFTDIPVTGNEQYGGGFNRNFEVGTDRLIFVVTESDGNRVTTLTQEQRNTALQSLNVSFKSDIEGIGHMSLPDLFITYKDAPNENMGGLYLVDAFNNFAFQNSGNIAKLNSQYSTINDIIALFGPGNLLVVGAGEYNRNQAPHLTTNREFIYVEAGDSPISLDLSAAFEDSDVDDTLTYRFTVSQNGSPVDNSGLSINEEGVLSGQLADGANYVVQVEASDGASSIAHTFALIGGRLNPIMPDGMLHVGTNGEDDLRHLRIVNGRFIDGEINEQISNTFYLLEEADRVSALSASAEIIDTIIIRATLDADGGLIFTDIPDNAKEEYGSFARSFVFDTARLIFMVTDSDGSPVTTLTQEQRNTAFSSLEFEFIAPPPNRPHSSPSLLISDTSDADTGGLLLNRVLLAGGGFQLFDHFTSNYDSSESIRDLFGVGKFLILGEDEITIPNRVARGDVTITADVDRIADATIGTILTADTSSIADDDGIGTFAYQWLRNAVEISGATDSIYTLTAADLATDITVKVNFSDNLGRVEEIISSTPYSPLTQNNAASGDVTITADVARIADATIGTILTADASSIADDDGIGTFAYQWLRDAVEISGATDSTYTLIDLDLGQSITVKVKFNDMLDRAEEITSSMPYLPPHPPNNAPVVVDNARIAFIQAAGAVSIDFTEFFREDDARQTLTYTLASFDADGNSFTAASIMPDAANAAALMQYHAAFTAATGLTFSNGMLTGTLAAGKNHVLTVSATDDHPDLGTVSHTISLTAADAYDFVPTPAGARIHVEAPAVDSANPNFISKLAIKKDASNIFHLGAGTEIAGLSDEGEGHVDTIIINLKFENDQITFTTINDPNDAFGGEQVFVLASDDSRYLANRSFEFGVDRLIFVVDNIDTIDVAQRQNILKAFAFDSSATNTDISIDGSFSAAGSLLIREAFEDNSDLPPVGGDIASIMKLFGEGNFVVIGATEFVAPIAAPNVVPIGVAPAPIMLTVGDANSIDFASYFTDTDGPRALQYMIRSITRTSDSATVTPAELGITDANAAAHDSIPFTLAADTYHLVVIANDRDDVSNEIMVELRVVNDAPLAIANPALPAAVSMDFADVSKPTGAFVLSAADLMGFFSDENISGLSFSVTVDESSTALLTATQNGTGFELVFTRPTQNDHDGVLTIAAADGVNAATEIEFNFNLAANVPLAAVVNHGQNMSIELVYASGFGDAAVFTPVSYAISLADLFTNDAGGEVSYTLVNGADDSNPMTIETKPAGIVFDASGEMITVGSDVAGGVYNLSIDGIETFGATIREAVSVPLKVTVNHAPHLKQALPSDAHLKHTSFTLDLANYFDDRDADDTISYSIPGGFTATDSSTTTNAAISGTVLTLNTDDLAVTPLVSGTIDIIATDSSGAVTTVTLNFMAKANQLPVADPDTATITAAISLANTLDKIPATGRITYSDAENDTILFYIARGDTSLIAQNFMSVSDKAMTIKGKWGVLTVSETATGIVTWSYSANPSAYDKDMAREDIFTLRTSDDDRAPGGETIDHNDSSTYLEQIITITIAQESTLKKNTPNPLASAPPSEAIIPLVPAASDTGKKSDAGYKITGDDKADAAQIIIADQAPDVIAASRFGDRIDAGRGIDKIKLAAEMAVDTVYYTIGVKEIGVEKDISWIAYDGADTIENFERGVDKLVFTLRVSGEVAEAGEAYYNNNAGDNVDLRPIYAVDGAMVSGIELGFGVSGGSYGGISTGNVLTINFAAELATADYAALAAMGLAEVLGSTETGAMDVFDVNFEFVAANNAAEVARRSGFIDAIAVARVGVDISVDLEQISDADGLTEALADEATRFSYQWVRLDSGGLGDVLPSFALMDDSGFGGSGTNGAREVADADGVYTPDAVNIGDFIRVIVSFRDDAGNAESVSSDAVRIIPAAVSASALDFYESDSAPAPALDVDAALPLDIL